MGNLSDLVAMSFGATHEHYQAKIAKLEAEIAELKAFKEGVIANLPSCGSCCEEILCGGSMHPHTCGKPETCTVTQISE